MGGYFGVSTIFIICLLGISANAEVFTIGSSSGSDITQVSSLSCFPRNLQNHFLALTR